MRGTYLDHVGQTFEEFSRGIHVLQHLHRAYDIILLALFTELFSTRMLIPQGPGRFDSVRFAGRQWGIRVEWKEGIL